MSNPASVRSAVVAIVKRVGQTPIDPTPDSELTADLGFDSLRLLELIADLEDHFDICIPLNDVPAIKTVGEVIAHVEQRLPSQGRA